MVVDALAVAAPNLFMPGSGDVRHLVDAGRALGIEGHVVAPGRPPTYALPPANDRLAEAAEGLTSVARLGRVDPHQGSDAVAEARRCLDVLGCAGLFLHPGEEVFPIRQAAAVVAEAAVRGAPVVVATGTYALSEPLQVLDLARAVPDAVVVMTSGGQINISGLSMVDAWAALQSSANLHVMTNGEYRQDYLERLVRDLDPRRLLFASFTPYYEQAFELRRVHSMDVGAEDRALVLGGNARRIFRL
ncbi:MAG TPA: amidohydrolase family protein [Geodermatophilus sp.]|nr:amidohydrolase family protein [Geodermatophilus sp.]